jgi:pyrophosphatase PpaX
MKGILFDLDGTLVDSLTATFEAFNHGIVSHGGREHTPQEILAYFGPGEGEIFAQILGLDQAASAYQASRDYMDANMGRVPLHEGVGDLLERMKSAGVPVSIVTGRSWETTELILRHHGLLDRFVTVVANDHVTSPKPSPEGLRLALSRMGLDPADTCYVGDSPVDMQAARSAGASGVAALWDLLANRENLEKFDPHHFAEHPSSVWEYWLRSQ